MEYNIGKLLFILISCVSILASLVGLSVYGSYMQLRGPIWLRNQSIGAWLSICLLFFSLQTIYLLSKNSSRFRKLKFTTDLIYYSLALTGSGLITLGYSLVERLDSIVFSSSINLICLVNLFVLLRRGYQLKLTKSQRTYIPTNEPDVQHIETELLFKNEDSCCKSFARITNIVFKSLFLILVGLLANGAIQNGIGSLRFPPRGKFVNVPLSDISNRYLKIHYLCDGPKDSQYPTFMFEGDSTQSYADYLQIQTLLKSKNRRSCVWDKAGLGHSDYLYSNMYNHTLYYQNFLSLINETQPFIFVGSGRHGASLVYEYASQHPQMVHSITLLEPSLKHKTSKLEKRFVNLINSILVPFGLMPLFNPKSDAQSDFRGETNWFHYTEKKWIIQKYFYDDAISSEQDVFKIYRINRNISINQIMCVKSDEQVVNKICKPQKLEENSDSCLNAIDENKKLINESKKLVELTENGKIYEANGDDCDLEFFVINEPEFTVRALIQLYP